MVAAGARLGPYEILAPIGKGGIGEAWKTRDARLGREVAIKLSKEKFSERFEHEAEEPCSSLGRTCSEMGDLVKWPSEACESG